MRFKNIASGSSGNSTYIGSDKTHILVDAGISKKRTLEGLAQADIGLCDISAILITHEHADHISALGVLERACSVPVYATEGTIRGILAGKNAGNLQKDIFRIIKADEPFTVGDILIKPLKICHDANEPVCFRFENGGKSAAIVTDLGIYDQYLVENLRGLNIIMAEANHDVRMLEAGRYPYFLKQRILGKYGHLSNESGGRLLADILNDDVREIILAHLSKENNYPSLAKLSVETEIDAAKNKYKSSDFKITAARPDLPLETMEV